MGPTHIALEWHPAHDDVEGGVAKYRIFVNSRGRPRSPASVAGLTDNASLSPFTGQVTYSIPIDLPASRAGFGPSMAVAYNGALGNGPLGIGWSIVAPHIRCNTRPGVPSYTSEDEFELGGAGSAGEGGRVRGSWCRFEEGS